MSETLDIVVQMDKPMIGLLFGTLMAGIAVGAGAQEPALGASVSALLAYARAHSPELSMFQQEAEAAAARIAPAGALPDPKFRTELRDITRMGEQSATVLPGRVGSTRYLLMQDLPWMGKRDLRRSVAEALAETAQTRVAGSWIELAGKIKAAHARLHYLEQNARLTREILELMGRLEKLAQARYAGGLAAQQDVIRAQLEQSAMSNELISLEAERRQLHARLNALIGRPSAEPLAAPLSMRALPAPARMGLATLQERARAHNPLLRAEDSQIAAAESSRALTYRNRYPDVTVGISPVQYQSAVKEWELMFEINIPLQQDARRGQEREAEAMLAAARARRDAVSNQILAELDENLAAYDAARRALALATETLLPQSELALRAALAGYETGKVDFATLLDAQRQLRQARLSQARAGADAQLRLADIERLVGEEL